MHVAEGTSGVEVVGTRAYLSTKEGLKVFNVKNESKPVILMGVYKTAGDAQGVAVNQQNGRIFMADVGLWVLDDGVDSSDDDLTYLYGVIPAVFFLILGLLLYFCLCKKKNEEQGSNTEANDNPNEPTQMTWRCRSQGEAGHAPRPNETNTGNHSFSLSSFFLKRVE